MNFWKLAASMLLASLLMTGCVASAPGQSGSEGGAGAAKSEQPAATAAGASDDSTNADASESSLVLKLGGIEYPYTEAVIAEFKTAHPNIEVEWTEGGHSFEDGSIQTLLRSGTGPDAMVVSSGPGRVGLLSHAGLILPLDDIFERHNIAEAYQEWVITQTRTQGKGQIFEIVEGVDVFQVHYNKEIFAEHGVQPPETWEDMLAVCDTLQAGGVLPIIAGVRGGIGGGWLLGNIVEAAAGKDLMTEVIYGDGHFDNEKIILGGTMLQELMDHGCINGSEALAIDQDQAQAGFIQGQGAMTVSPQGMIVSSRKDGIDVSKFSTFLLPSREEGRPSRPSAGLAHSWIVNAATTNQEAVEQWLAWVASEDYLRTAAANGAVLVPVRQVPDGVELDPAVQNAISMLEAGAGYNPSVYLPAKAKEAWYTGVQGIIAGSMSPEEAMQGVEAELSKAKQQ